MAVNHLHSSAYVQNSHVGHTKHLEFNADLRSEGIFQKKCIKKIIPKNLFFQNIPSPRKKKFWV
jgi:hypothetical protein